MPYYKIQVLSATAGEQARTCVHADSLAEARAEGMKQLGTTSAYRIDVGECTAAEWLAEESKRRGVPAQEISLPE